MSALASDIEDERRPYPSQTSLSYRPTSEFSSSQYTSTTNNPSWMPPPPPQQQQQQQYHHYHEKQQRYPHSFSKIFISIIKKRNK